MVSQHGLSHPPDVPAATHWINPGRRWGRSLDRSGTSLGSGEGAGTSLGSGEGAGTSLGSGKGAGDALGHVAGVATGVGGVCLGSGTVAGSVWDVSGIGWSCGCCHFDSSSIQSLTNIPVMLMPFVNCTVFFCTVHLQKPVTQVVAGDWRGRWGRARVLGMPLGMSFGVGTGEGGVCNEVREGLELTNIPVM